MKILRLSHLAIYCWMLGVTLTLSGTVLLVEGADAAEVVYLGIAFMLTGLTAPPIQGLFNSLRGLYEYRTAKRGEGQ